MDEVGTPVQGLELAHLFMGPVPAEHERARGAGPHDRVRVVFLDEGLGPLGEPAGGSEVEQRIDPVCILAHRGANDGQAQVVAQPRLELGKVVLGAETGVEQPDSGHARLLVSRDCQHSSTLRPVPVPLYLAAPRDGSAQFSSRIAAPLVAGQRRRTGSQQ